MSTLTSSPPHWTPRQVLTNLSAPLPILAAAISEPSASRSPKPWRVAPFSIIWMTASTFPHSRAMPSVSCLVMMPFSYQSMATLRI